MIYKSRVNKKMLMTISRILANLYKDGISINDSLDILEDSIYDKKYKNSIGKINVYTKEGKSLSEGFKLFPEIYPSLFTGFISIGENTGKLYETLFGVSMFYEKYIKILNKIKSALSYPCFILIVFILMITIFSTNMIPVFIEMYEGLDVEVPKSSLLLYNIINEFKESFISSSLLTLSIFGAILLVGIIVIKKMNFTLFKNFKIIRDCLEYMTVLIFSIICSTGINISYALSYCKDSINPNYLNNKIKEINENLIKGQELSEALEKSDLLSKYSLALVKTREHSGSIKSGFEELEKNLEYELDININRYISRINPICITVISVSILIFFLTTLLPLFDNLTSGIIV